MRDHKPTLNKPVSNTEENMENSAESSDNKKDDDSKAENSEGNAKNDNNEGIYIIKINWRVLLKVHWASQISLVFNLSSKVIKVFFRLSLLSGQWIFKRLLNYLIDWSINLRLRTWGSVPSRVLGNFSSSPAYVSFCFQQVILKFIIFAFVRTCLPYFL